MAITKNNPPTLRATSLQREGKYKLEYYAWRHLPYEQFQGLNILFTLFDTLTRIPETVTEPHVAHHKLAFFREDIAKVSSNTAQHPQVRALSSLNIDLTPWNDICIAIETDIDRIQLIDDSDVDRYCRRKRGSLLLMCGEFLKQASLDEKEKNELIALGVFIERVILLQEKRIQSGLLRRNDNINSMFILKKLYAALLNLIQKHPTEYVTLNPVHTFFLSIYYRLRGFK